MGGGGRLDVPVLTPQGDTSHLLPLFYYMQFRNYCSSSSHPNLRLTASEDIVAIRSFKVGHLISKLTL